MNSKKVALFLGMVLIVIGVFLVVTSIFCSQITVAGSPLQWYGWILIITGGLAVFAYKSGHIPT